MSLSSPQSSLLPPSTPAFLALADGTVYEGVSVGADGEAVGEVVFNTATTGYQEILTDPSYAQQLVTLTYPHIGNVGVNPEDVEGDRPYAAGLIVKDVPNRASNHRMTQTLVDYLREHAKVAIAGIDTRHLTQHLREHGAQPGCVMAGAQATPTAALEKARTFRGLSGVDLAQIISTKKPYTWDETAWEPEKGYGRMLSPRFHVVAYDFGVKRNILRILASHGCKLTVVPAQTSAEDVLAMQPDGVFLSNGPGDPAPCGYAIEAARTLIARGKPMFGICLGHQIMALAAGASTYKMKFGHHGGNHPVQELESKRVFITSQNHGFAVDAKTLPPNVQATHVSLFDGSLQGLRYTDRPAFSFQGHPEASPGPRDITPLFDHFIDHFIDLMAHA
ncbi:MAG: glutamine-hydrolyzing carbamoyl-phosphate synthase small subunit [Proteobacteria bacterium]|nr:glutamine-hydrolyzing carbamoyl-phosphate synthase small subunit [Pseudomonadota bacterium]MCL2306834.1 glutamine-hydrolyzing carbamoyl-phosphate synthase small subunit [Pseudomonadota bacterium]